MSTTNLICSHCRNVGSLERQRSRPKPQNADQTRIPRQLAGRVLGWTENRKLRGRTHRDRTIAQAIASGLISVGGYRPYYEIGQVRTIPRRY